MDAELALSSDDIDRLRVAMIRVGRQIRTHARGDLTSSQVAVLGTVIKFQPVTNRQVAELEHVSAPTSSKIIDTLERAGLVTRTPDPKDRRRVQVNVTASGNEYADDLRRAGRTWLARRIDDLESPDVALIAAALPALERLLAEPPR